MKRVFLTLAVLFGLCFPGMVAVGSVAAVDVLPPGCKADICKENQTNATDNPIFGPNGIMTNIIAVLSIIVGVIGMITVFISAVMFVMAGGDSTKLATARRTLTYALVGLLIAAMARTVVVFVLSKV